MTTPVRFSDLGLAAPILETLEEIGYQSPSPIQAEAIPPLLEGRDILGQAQTGTGKTAAFALPLLSRIDVARRRPQVLVLAPTRELAMQVCEAFQNYARRLGGFQIVPIYGGQPMSQQLRQLKRGAHVVVGTPGRVMDHLRRGTLELGGLGALVLDEADEMLKMGFIDDVEWIMERRPEGCQIALFSATMPREIARIARRHLQSPAEVKIASRASTVDAIEQRYWQASGTHKLDALSRIVEAEPFDAMIVFARTKSATTELAERLRERGHAAAALNGDMNQQAREQTVAHLKSGTLDIVVATDVAARGLDVARITHVVNYDIPFDTEAYVHRIGRTGRAGRKGCAILFVSPREKRMLRAIERATGQKIEPMTLPTRQQVAERRIADFKQRVTETLASEKLEPFLEIVESLQQEHGLAPERLAAALALMAQRERPLFPPPEKLRAAPERNEKKKERRPRHLAGTQRPPAAGMARYRINVGRAHGAQPKNIVGAIANEAGLDSRHIGHIKLYDHHATVDLPDAMPPELLRHLKKVRVCNRRLDIDFAERAARA